MSSIELERLSGLHLTEIEISLFDVYGEEKGIECSTAEEIEAYFTDNTFKVNMAFSNTHL